MNESQLLLERLINANLRFVDHWDNESTPVFVPALTTAERAIYTDLVAMAKSDFTAAMTLAEYQAIKPFLATERAFVQQSQSEFIALTQNQRDRLLFDTVTALIRIQRTMMRDG